MQGKRRVCGNSGVSGKHSLQVLHFEPPDFLIIFSSAATGGLTVPSPSRHQRRDFLST